MSEGKKQAQAAGKAKAAPSAQEAGAVVYIGPDIPGAKQYTVYNNGLPDALKEKMEGHPVFKSLVVPVGRLAQATAELAEEGSALGILFGKAQGAERKSS